jgi:uncharacterized protein YbbK (DUF523 family)
MGEWSEYFEDFPEENPANYIGGVFNPQEAKRIWALQEKQDATSKKANSKVNAMIAKAKKDTKARSLLLVEDCPQCGLKELNTYKITDKFYLCECQDCGIYGKGVTHEQALKHTLDAIGELKDWREGSEL